MLDVRTRSLIATKFTRRSKEITSLRKSHLRDRHAVAEFLGHIFKLSIIHRGNYEGRCIVKIACFTGLTEQRITLINVYIRSACMHICEVFVILRH